MEEQDKKANTSGAGEAGSDKAAAPEPQGTKGSQGARNAQAKPAARPQDKPAAGPQDAARPDTNTPAPSAAETAVQDAAPAAPGTPAKTVPAKPKKSARAQNATPAKTAPAGPKKPTPAQNPAATKPAKQDSPADPATSPAPTSPTAAEGTTETPPTKSPADAPESSTPATSPAPVKSTVAAKTAKQDSPAPEKKASPAAAATPLAAAAPASPIAPDVRGEGRGPAADDLGFPEEEFPDDGYPEGATDLADPRDEEDDYVLGDAPGTRRGAWVLTAVGLGLLGVFLLALLYSMSGENGLDPVNDAPGAAASAGPGQSNGAPATTSAAAKEPLTEISQAKVIVLNATKKPGLARTVNAALIKQGFPVIQVGNAEKVLPSGTAVIEHGPKGKLQAQEIARRFPGATLKETKRADTVVTVLVGPDFTDVSDPYGNAS